MWVRRVGYPKIVREGMWANWGPPSGVCQGDPTDGVYQGGHRGFPEGVAPGFVPRFGPHGGWPRGTPRGFGQVGFAMGSAERVPQGRSLKGGPRRMVQGASTKRCCPMGVHKVLSRLGFHQGRSSNGCPARVVHKLVNQGVPPSCVFQGKSSKWGSLREVRE
jgi:hypothetical protein